jgi:hypothetical protein
VERKFWESGSVYVDPHHSMGFLLNDAGHGFSRLAQIRTKETCPMDIGVQIVHHFPIA